MFALDSLEGAGARLGREGDGVLVQLISCRFAFEFGGVGLEGDHTTTTRAFDRFRPVDLRSLACCHGDGVVAHFAFGERGVTLGKNWGVEGDDLHSGGVGIVRWV